MFSKLKYPLLILFFAFILGYAAWPTETEGHPRLGVTNFDAVHLRCVDCATSVPVLIADQASGTGSGLAFEVRGAGTAVFSVSRTGVLNVTGGQILTQAVTYLIVNAPTAIGTATPAALINNAGVSNLLEIRDSSTPVFTINNGGAWSSTGAGTHSGGQTTNNWVKVAAPTAIATATPAAVIDSAGVSNLLEVRKNATPQFSVSGAGAVTGQVLQYATAGQRQFCATNTITDTASYTSSTTAVATPVYTWCSLGDITGDANNCAATHGTGSITVTIKNSAATPAANAAGAAVTWCVIGTP